MESETSKKKTKNSGTKNDEANARKQVVAIGNVLARRTQGIDSMLHQPRPNILDILTGDEFEDEKTQP